MGNTDYRIASDSADELTGVLGAVRTFTLTREAPAAARHFAVATMGHWGTEHLADDVALIVTELAANAIRHARWG